jgi:phosphoribosylamine-glycine ligase
VSAIGASIDEAAALAYARVERLHFEGMQARRDIGWQARRG